MHDSGQCAVNLHSLAPRFKICSQSRCPKQLVGLERGRKSEPEEWEANLGHSSALENNQPASQPSLARSLPPSNQCHVGDGR